jgi:hypothetical protein
MQILITNKYYITTVTGGVQMTNKKAMNASQIAITR